MRSLASNVIFLFVLMVLAPTMMFSQSSVDRDTSELQRLERIWNESHERGDADALEALWADDMEVAVPKMPVMRKADVLKFARSGRMQFLHYQTSDTRIRLYDNAAVVTGRLQRTRSTNGQEISDDWRFTKTYVRRPGTGAWFRSMPRKPQSHKARPRLPVTDGIMFWLLTDFFFGFKTEGWVCPICRKLRYKNHWSALEDDFRTLLLLDSGEAPQTSV